VWQFRNFARVLTKQITIQGFQARDHYDLMDEYHQRMEGWLDDGLVKCVGLVGISAFVLAWAWLVFLLFC
jgi:NADPH-dependent curcumin reductase CurA